MKMLKTKRAATGQYLVLDEHGNGIAMIVLEGVRGRDDYPWGYYYVTDVSWLRRATGTAQTKTEALDVISADWAQRPEVRD
jgi:hypothetical protein